MKRGIAKIFHRFGDAVEVLERLDQPEVLAGAGRVELDGGAIDQRVVAAKPP